MGKLLTSISEHDSQHIAHILGERKMMFSIVRTRTIAVALGVLALLAAGCAKSTTSPGANQNSSSMNLRIAPAEPEFDTDGWPINRNPVVGKGSTVSRPDGTEELLIDVREISAEVIPVMPRVVGP